MGSNCIAHILFLSDSLPDLIEAVTNPHDDKTRWGILVSVSVKGILLQQVGLKTFLVPTRCANRCYLIQISVAMEVTTNHTLSSCEQSDSGDDIPFENASDIEQSTPMETNQTDEIKNEGDIV